MQFRHDSKKFHIPQLLPIIKVYTEKNGLVHITIKRSVKGQFSWP